MELYLVLLIVAGLYIGYKGYFAVVEFVDKHDQRFVRMQRNLRK